MSLDAAERRACDFDLLRLRLPDLFCLCSGCYGISADEGELDDWLCARCEANATTVVSGLGEYPTQFELDCNQQNQVLTTKVH